MSKRLLLGTSNKVFLVEVTNFYNPNAFHFIDLATSNEGWIIENAMYDVPEQSMARASTKVADSVVILSEDESILAGMDIRTIIANALKNIEPAYKE